MILQSRIFLFLFLCIPTRLLITYLAYILDDKYKIYFASIIGIISFIFLILYFMNWRLKAFEGGNNTWWHEFRLIHGILFLCAFIYITQNSKYSWVPLFIDSIIGLILFIIKHLFKYNF